MNNSDINEVLINRIVDILKKDIYFKDGDLHFNIYNGDLGDIDKYSKSQGINVLLRNDGYIHNYLISYIENQYGLNSVESNLIWDKISLYLRKENFVYNLGWVLYEDYIQYEDDPYYVEGYRGKKFNIRNFNQFIKFIKDTGVGTSHDAHNDTSYNFLPMMDENDYREVYNYIMYRIEEDL